MTDAPDPELLDAGRLLFAGPCDFMLGVVGLEHLPPPGLPEICFAGRSNVGKSSLVNALTGRKTLARTSNTPGRTQELNYFNLGGQLLMVDMPGYGYAEAPKPLVDRWNRLIKAFLQGRVPLRRVFLLIDSRHGLKKPDREMMEMLTEAAVVYQVVLTKCDKPSKRDLEKVIRETRAALAKEVAAFPILSVTSTEKGEGIEALRANIAEIARDAA